MAIDWRERLKERLIEAGTVGVKQKLLTYNMRALATAPELVQQLEIWRKEEKVQRFQMLPGARMGRPVTYWRATTLLLEE